MILGIDPGLTGGLALYNYEANNFSFIEPMPVHEINKKKIINPYGMHALINKHAKDIKHVIIEEVSAMPNDGKVSAFRFGYASGAVLGVVASNLLQPTFIKPSVWKPVMGLSKDKGLSLQRATHLFPANASHFAAKKNDGLAEACLLAYFGFKHLGINK